MLKTGKLVNVHTLRICEWLNPATQNAVRLLAEEGGTSNNTKVRKRVVAQNIVDTYATDHPAKREAHHGDWADLKQTSECP